MKLSAPKQSLRPLVGLSVCSRRSGSKKLWPHVPVPRVPTEQSRRGYGVTTQSTGLSGWQGDFPLPTPTCSQLLTKGDFNLIAGSFLFFPGSETAAGISTHAPGVPQPSDNQRTEGLHRSAGNHAAAIGRSSNTGNHSLANAPAQTNTCAFPFMSMGQGSWRNGRVHR